MKQGKPLQRKTPLRRRPWYYRPKPRAKRTHAASGALKSPSVVIDPELRQQVRERACGKCDWCNLVLGDVFDAHHRKLRSRGGQDSLANLVALHHQCHMYIHEHVGEATARGFMVHSWENPSDIPVLAGDGNIYLPGDVWVDVEDEAALQAFEERV